MAKTEVTQSQWRAVMGTNPSRLDRCDDCPLEGISWNDAKLYADKLSRMTGKIYRLPSEAEWVEDCYHARYAGGPTDGSARTTSEGGRTAVQGTEVNAKTKDKDPAAKAAAEEASAREKEECKGRVLRGGSWLSSPQHTRAAHRLSIAPNSSSSSYGLRPVRSLR